MIRIIILLLCINVLALPVYTQSTIENHLLYSSHLQESRMISVALPSDYDKSDKAYSVLYVLDGEYIFDYAKGTVDFEIPVGAINESAGILYYNDKKEDAIRLLNYGVEIHPHSAALYGSLAEIHIAESKPQLAIAYYKKALDLSADNMQDFIKYKTLMKGMDKH